MPNPTQGMPALQNYVQQWGNQKISAAGWADLKKLALADQRLDQGEASFLLDQMLAQKFEAGALPAVKEFLTQPLAGPATLTPALIGRNRLLNVKPVAAGIDLNQAKAITAGNKIDEVYFKDEQGKLYLAYGSQETEGALDLAHIKEQYIGRFGSQKITVVHIDNETNTAWEGAKAPWISTGKMLKDAGQSGIAKGLAEMGGLITAMFIGKAALENGIKATEAAKAAAQLAESAKTAGDAARALSALGKARAFGSTVGQTVQSTLKGVAVAAGVAGAIVGTVVTVGSAIGAARGAWPQNDFTTLDMVTDQSFIAGP